MYLQLVCLYFVQNIHKCRCTPLYNVLEHIKQSIFQKLTLKITLNLTWWMPDLQINLNCIWSQLYKIFFSLIYLSYFILKFRAHFVGQCVSCDTMVCLVWFVSWHLKFSRLFNDEFWHKIVLLCTRVKKAGISTVNRCATFVFWVFTPLNRDTICIVLTTLAQ